MERMCSAVAKLPVIGDCGSSGRLNAPVFYKRDKAPQEVQFPEGRALPPREDRVERGAGRGQERRSVSQTRLMTPLSDVFPFWSSGVIYLWALI